MARVKKEIVDKAEKEVVLGYREITLDNFKGKTDVKIRIYHPDIGQQSDLSSFYAQRYNKILRDPDSNIPTRKQMLAILNEKSIWTQDDEKRTDSLRDKLSNVELEMIKERGKKKMNSATVTRLKDQYDKVRSAIMEQIANRESSMGQTIESLAERDTNLMKIVYCVTYSNGDKVWESLEDFKKENKEPKVYDIMTEATYFWNGLSREVLDLLPESLFSLGANSEQSQEEQGGKESTQ